ncbi:hypothetical protein DNTS_018312 [Danionella cerebrum]|uniref:Anti-proliferative protein domain-containing protein n=1 Tax=Danionella cerebrum TaxID=2873325 RepID=A0A553QEP5_9TELE|nr:hypothetical protein DNTS_018312 [Danionella translucida]
MHLEVKVALNFIVSYLYNKLPRRRADLFGEELERILMSHYEGHWYPDSPLRGSGFRCLHLGAPRDPLVDLAAQRSGLDTEEVHANVPPELSIWIDPYEVSYQIGDKGAVNILYLEDPPGPETGNCKGELEFEEAKSLAFNPEAQVFIPIGGQVSPDLISKSPSPVSTSSCPGIFGYPDLGAPSNTSLHSYNSCSPSPTSAGIAYPSQNSPQPMAFTTASFAATKFGSTKMKRIGNPGVSSSSNIVVASQQRMIVPSPTNISPPGLVNPKPLSLSMHPLPGLIPSQLSPSAKEFIFPISHMNPYFTPELPPSTPFSASHQHFDPFSSPTPQNLPMEIPGGTNGISFMDKPSFGDGLGYNFQYSGQVFQPVVLAN